MQLDSTSFPHILDAIVIAAAADYRDSVTGPTAIGLRATSRAVCDQFDKHLLLHVACRGGGVFTPSQRRIPASRPLKRRLTLLATYNHHARHTRILDYYPATVELAETVPWRDLRVLRCSGRVPPIPATTIVGNIYSSCSTVPWRDLRVLRCSGRVPPIPATTIVGNIYSSCSTRPVTLPEGARRAVLRFNWDMEGGDMVTHQLIRMLPPSLEELVLLLDEEYSRKLGASLTGHPCASEADAANAYQAAVTTLLQLQCAFVYRGGRVTFVRPNHFHFQKPIGPYLRRLAHMHIVDARFGKIPSAGSTEDTLRLYDHVGISEDDERLKDNVRVIGWDEWGDGAGQPEREWLDPMAEVAMGESVITPDRFPIQSVAAQVPYTARIGINDHPPHLNPGQKSGREDGRGCICM